MQDYTGYIYDEITISIPTGFIAAHCYVDVEVKKKKETFKRIVDKRDPRYVSKRKEFWAKHLN